MCYVIVIFILRPYLTGAYPLMGLLKSKQKNSLGKGLRNAFSEFIWDTYGLPLITD